MASGILKYMVDYINEYYSTARLEYVQYVLQTYQTTMCCIQGLEV